MTTVLPDLGHAEVMDRELNPLSSYSTEYAHLEELLAGVHFNNGKYKPTLKSLALNGQVKREKMEKYLKNDAISSSACKEVLKSPLHFFHHMNHLTDDKPKNHFALGEHSHSAFLEPKLFDKIAVEPNANLASHIGCNSIMGFYERICQVKRSEFPACQNWSLQEKKEYIQDLKSRYKGSIIKKEHLTIINILRSNYSRYGDGIIPKLMKGALHELSFYGKDSETGLDLKVRPDAINFKENIGVDAIISFKTTSAVSVEKFIYDTAKFKYELSEGMYQQVVSDITGRNFSATIMVMLQTIPPYAPAVFWWNADDLENGRYKYKNALYSIEQCYEKNLYPGFDARAENGHHGIITLSQPEWALKEMYPVDIEN